MSARLRPLSVLALLLVAFSAFAYAQDKGAAGDTENINRSFAIKSGGTVAVQNDRGSTTIDGWDKDQVSIDAVKHFEGDSKLRDDWMRRTQVVFDNTSDRVSVRVDRPNNFCVGWCNFRAWVDITVHAPRRVALDVRSDRTSTKLTSIEGDVKVDGDRSSIDIRNVAGSIHVNSDRGAVYMRDVEIRNGVDVRTDRAPIELYATKFSGGGRLVTDRSSITLRLPANANVSLEVARDRRSSFRTDFPVSTSGDLSGYGTVRGNINAGGPVLHLETDRGSISVEKGPTT